MKHEDDVLVARVRDGQSDAQRDLLCQWSPRVAAYLRRSGFRPSDVADLTQDVSWRVIRSIHTFDSTKGTLGGWIRTIAKNVARKAWAKRPAPESIDPELAEQTLDDARRPDASIAEAEQFELLDGCVEQLPARLRQVIELRYINAMTTRGISAELEMAESTVRSHLDKATYLLRQCLASKGIEGL